MKKTVAMIIATLLCVTLICSCSDKRTGTADGTNKENPAMSDGRGTSSKAPEKKTLSQPETNISLDGIPQLTIGYTTDISGIERIRVHGVIGYDTLCGADMRYYKAEYSGKDENVIICDKKGDRTVQYKKTDDGFAQDNTVNGYIAMSMYADEYYTFGFDYADRYADAVFTVSGDSDYDNEKYYAYTMNAREKSGGKEIVMDILVNKKTGLWEKTTYTQDGITYTTTLTDVAYDALEIPGIVPSSVSESVIYEQNNIKLSINSLEFDETNTAATVGMTLENSNPYPVLATAQTFCINGMCLGGSVYSEGCLAGGSVTFTVEIPDVTLAVNNIDRIHTVQTDFRLSAATANRTGYDTPVWYTEGEIIADCRSKEAVTDAGKTTNKVIPDGVTLIDNEYLTLTAVSFEIAEDGNAYFRAYCKNKTDDLLRTTVRIKSVTTKDGNVISTDRYDRITMQRNGEGYDMFVIYADTLAKYNMKDMISAKITCEVLSGERYSESVIVVPETEEKTLSCK